MKFDWKKYFNIEKYLKIEKSTCLNGFLKLFFTLGGISENAKLEIAISSAITIAAIFELLGCVIGLMNTDGIDILLPELVAYALFLSYHWIIKIHKKRVVQFAFLVRHPNMKFFSEEMNEKLLDSFAKMVPFVILFNTVLLSSISLPMWIPLFTEIGFENSLTYIMPFWYFCDEGGRNNFPVSFLCFHVNDFNQHWYWIINIAAYVSVVIGLLIYQSTSIFYLFTQIYLRMHHRCILERIEKLARISNEYHAKIDATRTTNSKMNTNLKRKYDKITNDEFADVIRHYQFIFSITQNIVPIYRSIISSTLVGMYTIGVFCIFYFLSITEVDASQLIFQLKMGLILVMMMVIFLFYCFSVDSIAHMNDEISAAVYETPWHRNSLQYRKMLLILLSQTQKPIAVTAFGMYRISLNYYMLMLKNIYSILNVLLIKLGTK